MVLHPLRQSPGHDCLSWLLFLIKYLKILAGVIFRLNDLKIPVLHGETEEAPEFLRALKMHPSDAPVMLRREERTGLDTDNFDFYLVCGYLRSTVIG